MTIKRVYKDTLMTTYTGEPLYIAGGYIDGRYYEACGSKPHIALLNAFKLHYLELKRRLDIAVRYGK